MKYKTFRTLMVTGVLAAGAGGTYWYASTRPPEPEQVIAEPVETPPSPAPRPVASQPVLPMGTTPSMSNLRQVDTDTLALLRRGVKEEKVKDAFPKQPYKVNLYRDGGAAEANRLKIDLDRDEKWDEKWDVEREPSGELKVKRHVAPADDEQYTDEYRLNGSMWVDKDGNGPPVPMPAPQAGLPLRDLDRQVLARSKTALGGDKAKDAIPGQAWKVNLYQDGGKAKPNRLKIDLDRDDKWDEKWDLADDGAVVRQVAPADDEKYTEVYDLAGDGWRKR